MGDRSPHRVIGGSDNHLGTPGLDDYAPTVQQHAGLAVVLASACTREAIFDALEARRCYATTGPRILLDVTVDGQPMGSEISRGAKATIPIDVRVTGTSALASVEIVKLVGGDFVTVKTAALDPGAETSTLAFVDSLDASTLYYVRVLQTDGEMAWSSPVWIDMSSSS